MLPDWRGLLQARWQKEGRGGRQERQNPHPFRSSKEISSLQALRVLHHLLQKGGQPWWTSSASVLCGLCTPFFSHQQRNHIAQRGRKTEQRSKHIIRLCHPHHPIRIGSASGAPERHAPRHLQSWGDSIPPPWIPSIWYPSSLQRSPP